MPDAEDRAFRRAAEAYFAEKSPLAEQRFDKKLLDVFRTFELHWRDYFAPEDGERLREYLALPREQRRTQFDRFRRECRSWEVNFKLMALPRRSSGNGNGNGDASSHMRRRRIQRNLEREADVRALYAGLDTRLEQSLRQRHLPVHLLPHLRLLGLGADVSYEQLRSRYRELAKRHHPDRAGDEVMMQRLNHAFRTLLKHLKPDQG